MTTSTGSSNSNSERSRQIPIVCPGHTRPLAELQFIQVPEDGGTTKRTLLISACHDRMPMVRDGTTGDWIGTFQGHKGAVWSCQMDPSGSLAATASGDFSVKVWDAITGQALWNFNHSHIVKTCVFSPNSELLATGGKESLLRIYDLTKYTNKSGDGDSATPMLQIQQPSQITKCVWMSDTLILCACADGIVRGWEIPKNSAGNDDDVAAATAATVPTEPKFSITTEKGDEIRDMELVPTTSDDTKLMLTVAAGENVYFFEINKDHHSLPPKMIHVYPMPIHFREEGGASLHPSGTKFVAGGSDLWIRVFDFETGQELECHKGHHGPIRCVRYSPDGSIYATGSEDGTIRLWKTNPE